MRLGQAVHLHDKLTIAFGGLKMQTFENAKCKFLKIIPLSSLCKLQKCEFTKTVMSCVCVLHILSLSMYAGAKRFFTK